VVTISAFEKSIGFNRAIFTTGYYDFEFNPYGDFGYGMAELLLYDYEKSQVGLLKKRAAKGRKLIHDKNAKKLFLFQFNVFSVRGHGASWLGKLKIFNSKPNWERWRKIYC